MQENYNVDMQQLLLCFLISDADLWTRSSSVIKPIYFHQSLRGVVEFFIEYSSEYNALPKIEQIKIRTDIDLIKIADVTEADKDWFLDNIEIFCKRKALQQWIMEGPDLIDDGNFGALEAGLKDALLMSLDKNIGTQYYADPRARLTAMKENNGQMSTGWKTLDKLLYGGFNRGELNIFAASSGGGKSLFLQNIALNKSLDDGMNVVYVSIELSEDLISMRLDSMVTGFASTEIYKKLDQVHDIVQTRGKKAGFLIIKYLPQGSTTNDIKALLKEVELETGKRPDAIIVDYLDLVYPNDSRIDSNNAFLKDKIVSEELRGLSIEMYGKDHKLLLVTASQFNRSGVEETDYTHANIAGGISKINTADNLFAIHWGDILKENGRIQLQLLKTRNSAGVGQRIDLSYNKATLKISDLDEDEIMNSPIKTPNILSQVQSKNIVNRAQPSTTPVVGTNNILQIMADMKAKNK